MKINDFTALVAATIVDLNARTATAATAYANSADKSKDEITVLYLAHKALQTKVKHVAMLQSESVANKAASFVKDDAMLAEIVRDSYMLAKFAAICTAIATKSKAAFADDSALAQALAFFALNDFKAVQHDTLRKNLFSVSDTSKCHTTDRQSSMICNLFERLKVATRTKLDDKKATEFTQDATIIKSLLALYA